jgi:hypothetical protein
MYKLTSLVHGCLSCVMFRTTVCRVPAHSLKKIVATWLQCLFNMSQALQRPPHLLYQAAGNATACPAVALLWPFKPCTRAPTAKDLCTHSMHEIHLNAAHGRNHVSPVSHLARDQSEPTDVEHQQEHLQPHQYHMTTMKVYYISTASYAMKWRR